MKYLSILALFLASTTLICAQESSTDRIGYDGKDHITIKRNASNDNILVMPIKGSKLKGTRIFQKPVKIAGRNLIMERIGAVIRIINKQNKTLLLTDPTGEQVHLLEEGAMFWVIKKFAGCEFRDKQGNSILSAQLVDRKLKFTFHQPGLSNLLYIIATEHLLQKLAERDQFNLFTLL